MMKPKNGNRVKPGLATVLLFGALMTGIFAEDPRIKRVEILVLWFTIATPYGLGLIDGKSS